METSILLAKSILELFTYVAIGFVIVKTKIFKEQDSKILSLFVIYIAAPCMIIKAFQVEVTPNKMKGFILALAAGVAIHLLFIILTKVISLVSSDTLFNTIDKGTVIYSNAGNFTMPLVVSMLGSEWLLYSCGYLIVQIILLWTHAVVLISEEKKLQPKKILSNVNIISIAIGILLFTFRIKLPTTLTNVCGTLGNVMGPISMVVVGMAFANMDLKRIFLNKRCYLVCFVRLFVYPVITILLLKVTGVSTLLPDAGSIIFITVLQCSAPAASMITQLSQLYDKDTGYAAALNIMSVCFCIFSMPVMIYLYQILV